MTQSVPGGWAHKAIVACAGGIALQLAVTAAHAQATPNASTPNDGAPSEAARRAAMSPYRFILAAPPRKAAPAEAKPAPEPRPAAETKRPEPPPVQQAARTAPVPVAPSPAPQAAPEPPPVMPAAAPAPAAPTEAVAARTRPPEPPPVRREVIPVRIDEPRLPAQLLRERPSGLVKVQFEIHPDGSTKDVKVTSSTNRALNRHTVEAVSAWKFEPVDEILTIETEVAFKFD